MKRLICSLEVDEFSSHEGISLVLFYIYISDQAIQKFDSVSSQGTACSSIKYKLLTFLENLMIFES